MRSRTALSCLLALLLPVLVAAPAWPAGELTVVQLAVGQNEAALFQGPCGEVGILDAGDGSADEISTGLTGLGATSVAWLAASHYHSDHIGDVADLQVDVPVVYDRGGGAAGYASATYDAYLSYAEARLHTALDIGDQLTLCADSDQVTFTVLSAGADGTAADGVAVTDENDRSLCFLVEYGDFDMASCGDINGSDEGERTDVESAVADALGDVEVLKVNHHGSAHSSSTSFVQAVQPNVSIISVGQNTYGHPDPGAVSRLDQAGHVFTTNSPVDGSVVDGDVTITTAGTSAFTLHTSGDGLTLSYGIDEAGGSMPPEPDEPSVQPSPLRPPGVTRMAGTDRYLTAAAVSRGSFPGTANDVFIVTGANWPDALSAGPAAAAADAPVLPVQTTSVPAAIAQEVDRLQPRRAWVIGGTSAVADSVLSDLRGRGLDVVRISGTGRYETAAAVAARFFPQAQGAYYASGQGYPDALGGGAAAAHRGWPLLLTARDSLPPATPAVGAERIVLGGTAVVSEVVRQQLGARRVAGTDRYSTAAAIARDAFTSAQTVYLATGLNFPDALAGAPAAARDDAPLLLVAKDCVSQATRDAAVALGSTSRVVLGGTAVVSDLAAALTGCAAPAPAPAPVPTTSPAVPANPGDTKNCGDFATWREAQDWFERYYPYYGDAGQLDADDDLVACESLTGAP